MLFAGFKVCTEEEVINMHTLFCAAQVSKSHFRLSFEISAEEEIIVH